MNLAALGNFPNGPAGAQGFPVLGVVSKTAAFALASVRNANGLMFDLTGSFQAILPPLSGAAAGAPLWAHFRKRDGAVSGASVCTIACSGSDTFANGTTSINLYQEDVTLFSYGDVWRSPPGGRQRGWISIGTTTIASSVASLLLSIGLSDPELSQHLIDYWGVTKVSTSNLQLRVSKAATVDTGAHYYPSGVQGDGSSNPSSIRTGAGTYSGFPCDGSSSSTGINAGQVLVRNPTSTTAINQTVRVDGTVLIAGATSLYAKLEGYNNTAGAIDGLQFSASVNLTAGTFVQQALRL